MPEKKEYAPCAVYDFRLGSEDLTPEALIAGLRQLAKHWTFQEEKGEKTGYMHYQGRLSLIKKARKPAALELFDALKLPPPNFFEPTADAPLQFNYNCYAGKIATRIRGPWTDKDPTPPYVPRQYRGKLETMYPFQKFIYESATQFEDRIINMIFCPKGNKGKSTIASLCELFSKGLDLPPVNDADKLVQSACDICIAKQLRDPSPVFIDLPRAMNKERLNGIYTAIEQIKKGKLYDLRHRYQEWWIDSPQIWVFSNIEPDLSLLSRDRWKIWTINDSKELVRYDPNQRPEEVDWIDP